MGGNNLHLLPAHSARPKPFAPAPGVGVATSARTERREQSIRGGHQVPRSPPARFRGLLAPDSTARASSWRLLSSFRLGIESANDVSKEPARSSRSFSKNVVEHSLIMAPMAIARR